jgi:hypothetical protein
MFAVFLCGLTAAAATTQDGAAAIELARSTLGQWVETQRTISKERKDWSTAKELLSNQCALVQREIESARAKIAEAQASIDRAEKSQAQLLEQNQELLAASAALGGSITTLEARTKALLARLPEPLKGKVALLSQSLPDDPARTELSLATRLANVVGIVNEANKFQREIQLTSEVRELADGRSAEVATMYVGLGQAYYASANGAISGTGHGAGAAWEWTQDDRAAPAVLRALAIQQNEQVAGFVALPIEVR